MNRHSITHEVTLVLLWLSIWELYSIMVIYYKFTIKQRFLLASGLGIFAMLLYSSLWSSYQKTKNFPEYMSRY